VVLITHDESTFYANDRRKTRWVHESEKATPNPKGEGVSIMVSDFCSPDLGWLRSKDGKEEARVVFKAGKGRDGYFTNEDLLAQTEKAIELFEDNFPGNAIAAFAYDNATTHQKHAEDALSAHKAPKFPKIWPEKNGQQGCKMRDGCFSNKQPQSLYFPEDHPQHPGLFKGMAIILQERGFHNVANLPAQCAKFKCPDPDEGMCCCRHILFNQPDFKAQKSALEELIESHGHLVCFYPKFHCELNFIEQCWGYAKYHYQMLPLTKKEGQMEENIRNCLDRVDINKIHRYISISLNAVASNNIFQICQ